ncbi:uncharacterized protein IL334_002123 [Kwoniella shivajii]|uniref:Uncharacterized protein n=1 Tax=Kwoniella shivajii TaxID=564305 RepID=A0ABZ1CVF7_9TREE|nr:hypothetical protein IL334_002123 [Kwoniella shivajii]
MTPQHPANGYGYTKLNHTAQVYYPYDLPGSLRPGNHPSHHSHFPSGQASVHTQHSYNTTFPGTGGNPPPFHHSQQGTYTNGAHQQQAPNLYSPQSYGTAHAHQGHTQSFNNSQNYVCSSQPPTPSTANGQGSYGYTFHHLNGAHSFPSDGMVEGQPMTSECDIVSQLSSPTQAWNNQNHPSQHGPAQTTSLSQGSQYHSNYTPDPNLPKPSGGFW